jgi:hypothetical protein
MRSIESRIAALELKYLPPRPQATLDPAAVAARLEAGRRAQEAYEALPAAEKILAKQRQLAELRPHLLDTDRSEYAYCCRLIELDVLELQGAAPELIQLARWQADEAKRACKPLPPIPTAEDLAALRAAAETPRQAQPHEPVRAGTEPEYEFCPGALTVSALSRTALMALNHSRQQDTKLKDYGGHGSVVRVQTEPPHV